MIIDMHCHTKEGSVDARIGIKDYLSKLKGYDGILLTDHNSYGGYYKYKRLKEQKTIKVFKGIEYDTCDAGHMIVIMPKKVDTKFLVCQGMTIGQLEKLVHLFGGVLGAAHPFDYKLLGMGNIKRWTSSVKMLEMWYKLDFIEGFNSCGTPETNKMSQILGTHLNKPLTGGSDTHRMKSLGLAGTFIDDDPSTEDDLIELIKENRKVVLKDNQIYFKDAVSKTHKIIYNLGLAGCYANNKIKHCVYSNKYFKECINDSK